MSVPLIRPRRTSVPMRAPAKIVWYGTVGLFSLLLPGTVMAQGEPLQPEATAPQISSPQGSGSEEERDYIRRGSEAGQQGDLRRALDLFMEALRINPDSAVAHYYAGIARMQLRQHDQGIYHLRRAVDLAPTATGTRMALANAYEQVGRIPDAIEELEKAIAFAPNAPEAREADRRMRLLQGMVLAERGNLDAALQMFSALAQDYPNDPAALFNLARVYLTGNRLAEAIDVLQELLSRAPNHPGVHQLLGEAYERHGVAENAEKHYERAVELLPPDSPATKAVSLRLSVLRGIRRLNAREFADAERELNNVLAIDPNNFGALYNLAAVYRESGRYDQAEETLKRALGVLPKSIEVHFRLGELYLFDLKRSEEAAREFESVLQFGRGSQQAQHAANYLSQIYNTPQGREILERITNERIEGYRSRLAQDKDNSQLWRELAIIFQERRKFEEAAQAWEEVVRLEPANVEALQSLGLVYDSAGEFEKARTYYSKAINLQKDPDLLQRLRHALATVLAKISFEAGHLDAAATQFRQILASQPQNAEPYWYLALIHSRKNEPEKAEESYDKLLEHLPGNIAARANRALIYESTGREELALSEYGVVTRSVPPGAMLDFAKKRVNALQQRINGFSFSMGYTTSYDDNNNLSSIAPVAELRSDITAGVVYRRKLPGRPVTLGASFAPALLLMRYGQFDYIRTDLTPFVNWRWRDMDWSSRYSYNQTGSLSGDSTLSVTQSLAGSAVKRWQMPSLLPFFAKDEQDEKAQSVLNISFNARDYTSEVVSSFDTYNFSGEGGFSQDLGGGANWGVSYTLGKNKNKKSGGSDFAYWSHAVGVDFSKTFGSSVSVSGSANYTLLNYDNDDTLSIVRKQPEKRFNTQKALSLSVAYPINDQLRVFGTWSWQGQDSNLPSIWDVIILPEDVAQLKAEQVDAIRQSTSLGDYEHHIFSAGFAIAF